MFRKKYLAVIPLLIAIFGFAVVYFAPGTAERQAVCEKQTIFGTMFASIVEFLQLLEEWINIQWIGFIAIGTPFALEVVKTEKKKANRKYYPVLFTGSASIILLGMLCVPYYVMGHFGSGRLTNVIWMAFMLLSFACYTYILCWLQFYIKKEI